MTRTMRTASHLATPPIARALSALNVAWRRVAARLVAATQAERMAELSDRQLADYGLRDEQVRRARRVAVDGALMRRLMSRR